MTEHLENRNIPINLKTPPDNEPLHAIGDEVYFIKDYRIHKSRIESVNTKDYIIDFLDKNSERIYKIERTIHYTVEKECGNKMKESEVFETEELARKFGQLHISMDLIDLTKMPF